MTILLVGQADSIFFEQYIKHLKKNIPNINIDIYSISPITGKYDLSACRNIYVDKWFNSIFKNIKYINGIIYPFYSSLKLSLFLSKNKRNYDIVHFKWLIPSIVLLDLNRNTFSSLRFIATFWGSELETQKILMSRNLFKYQLKRFLKKVDIVTYHSDEQLGEVQKLGVSDFKLWYSIYGSSIYKLIEKQSFTQNRQSSKEFWGIAPDKITISLGYSGKELHQHLMIIEELLKDERFLENIDSYVFILPFTHGGAKSYYFKIIKLLENAHIKFLHISKKMTDSEVATLRFATDIMIQLSISDGRSASIIESFLAGSVVISGAWLPYQIFRDKNLYFHELSNIDSSLPDLILHIQNNLSFELEKCADNKIKWGFETWDNSIINWVNLYAKLEGKTNQIYVND